MKRLTASQLAELKQALGRRGPHQALQAELLDHLATEIETLVNDGQTYETALQQVMQEANPQALAHLKQTYQQSFGFVPIPTLPRRLSGRRYRNRQAVSAQLPTWLRVSAFTVVTLLICLMWVSQLFAVPLYVFNLVWISGLTSLCAAFSARLLFRPRSRTMRPRWI